MCMSQLSSSFIQQFSPVAYSLATAVQILWSGGSQQQLAYPSQRQLASQLFGQSLIRRLPNCQTFLTTVFTVSCYVIKRIIGFCCVYSLQSESCLHFISQPYAWAPCKMQIDTIQQLASYNLASQVMATTHEVHRFRFLAGLNENLKLTHKKTWC